MSFFFFPELEQFPSQNSRLWMSLVFLNAGWFCPWCEIVQWGFPPLLLAYMAKCKGSWILFSADFCRGQVVKSSNPFCAFLYATNPFPTWPEKKQCRNWDSCVEGMKSKGLLLSGCAGLGRGAAPGQDGSAGGSQAGCVQIRCWPCVSRLQGVGQGL